MDAHARAHAMDARSHADAFYTSAEQGKKERSKPENVALISDILRLSEETSARKLHQQKHPNL